MLQLRNEKLEKKEEKNPTKTPSLKSRASSALLFFGFVFVFTNRALGNLGNHYFKGLPFPQAFVRLSGSTCQEQD